MNKDQLDAMGGLNGAGSRSILGGARGDAWGDHAQAGTVEDLGAPEGASMTFHVCNREPLYFRGLDTGSIFIRSAHGFVVLVGKGNFQGQEGERLSPGVVTAGLGVEAIPSPFEPLLPCDVMVGSNMRITKGCKLSTLINALERRGMARPV